MRLTGFGLKGVVFYATTLVAFYATPYSNLFFLLLGFLTLLGLLGAVAAHRNLRGVSAAFDELAPVPSDASVVLPVELFASGGVRFQVAAHVELEGGRRISGTLDVLEGRGTLALRCPPLPRGCYTVARAIVESSHPFGLVRARRVSQTEGELIVYPSPRSSIEGRSAADALDELLGRGDPGAGDLQPASLRDHREGDGVRGIHWRASARRGRLVVQEWEGGSGQGLEVVLDRRCEPDVLEKALATVSAMVALARINKETLRIYSQDLSATFGDGQRPWSEALRFLACAELVPEHGLAPPATSPNVARLPRALAHA